MKEIEKLRAALKQSNAAINNLWVPRDWSLWQWKQQGRVVISLAGEAEEDLAVCWADVSIFITEWEWATLG